MPEYLPLGSFRQGLLPADCGSCAWWFTTGASGPGGPVASAERHEWLAELEHEWGPAGLLVLEPAPRRRGAGAGDPVISASIHFAPASSLPRFRELPFPALPPSSALLFCFHADEHAPHWMAKELIRKSLYELRRRGIDEVFAVAFWPDGDDRGDSCRFFRADFLVENGFEQVAGDVSLCLMRVDNRGLVSLLSQVESVLRRVFSRGHEPAPSPAAWVQGGGAERGAR